MSIHSRLSPDLTLEERAAAINVLLEKIYIREQQTERLRWRVAIELHAARRLVPTGQWEMWCENNIRRSLGDIRKLLKMADAHDPEAAHNAEKAAQRETRSAPEKARIMRVDDSQRFDAAWELIQAILAKFSRIDARALLELVEVGDLLEAVDAHVDRPNVPIVSTATH